MKKLAISIFAVIFMVLGLIYFNKPDSQVPDSGLLEAVAGKREAIYEAALARDYEALAAEADPSINYSFGGPVEGGLATYLRTSDGNLAKVQGAKKQNNFEIIETLLDLPYAKQGNLYIWPAVFLKASSDWTEDDLAQMKELLTDQQIEGYRNFGAYAYYRLGITEEGKWVYYLAGD